MVMNTLNSARILGENRLSLILKEAIFVPRRIGKLTLLMGHVILNFVGRLLDVQTKSHIKRSCI